MILQKKLRAFGLNVRIDGYFGRATHIAVETFQLSQGLENDGIVGPETWAKLNGETLTIPADKTTPIYHTTYPEDHPRLRKDALEAQKYREAIIDAAVRYGFSASLVAAIGSRESRWGYALTPKGPAGRGDHGHGHGLMQVDDRYHSEFLRRGTWKNPEEILDYALRLLRSYVKEIEQTTSLKGEPALRAGLAAYNCGCGNVRKALRYGFDVDHYTSGRDYSKDVYNRAGWFQARGWS